MVKVEVAPNQSEPILLSLRDASVQLCIAVPTLRRWLREHRLAHVRCGRAVRIEAAEVQRFIDRNRHPAGDEQKVKPGPAGQAAGKATGSRKGNRR